MPHYYFNIQNQTSFTPDPTGREMNDLKAARREGINAAGDVIIDEMLKDGDHSVIEVQVEENGSRRLTIRLEATIEQAD